MRQNKTPLLDPRDAEQVFKELLARGSDYVPELTPAEGGPGQALMQIFARYMEVIIHRLNQAPDKNLLAFLDMLGISLIPPQSSRAPVVFEPLPNAGNGRIAAHTCLGAQVLDRPNPLMFETENAIAMAAARLVEVKTLWPARDEYADHTMPAAGRQTFTLFEPLAPVPHEFYLAHDTLFGFEEGAAVTIEIEFELATPGSVPLKIVWEFWDGKVWRQFRDIKPGNRAASQDSTSGLTKSGRVALRPECGQSQKKSINGFNAHWVRGRLDQSLPPDQNRVLPEVDRIRLRSRLERHFIKILFEPIDVRARRFSGSDSDDDSVNDFFAGNTIRPEQAFSNAVSLDVSQTFFPFGHHPQPGSTFYFSSEEVFGKAGADVVLSVKVVGSTVPSNLTPITRWEFWNGLRWATLTTMTRVKTNADLPAFPDFQKSEDWTFVVPNEIARREINGEEALWLRARLVSGGYGTQREVEFDGLPTFIIVETVPPAVTDFRFGYVYRSSWESPDHCLAYNDFQFTLHSNDVRWPGGFFPPFRPASDTTPALYLGFDRPLPNDLISLYLDIAATEMVSPLLLWEAWDGASWRELAVTDETVNLSRPGMVSFIAPDIAPRPEISVIRASGNQISLNDELEGAVFQPGDRVLVQQDKKREMVIVDKIDADIMFLAAPLTETYTGGSVGMAALPRFGVPRDWIRVRLKADGAPPKSQINGIHLNAAWAVQVQSLNDELLGSGTGQQNQSLFFSQVPVLPGERIEVRELEGARAEIELPILKEQLLQQGFAGGDIRSVVNPRSGAVTEVWVRWQFRPHLFYSGPDDRHYMLERTAGRLIFGDGQHGRIPTIAANNIMARRYQTGGGLVGNVPSNSITQLLGVAPFVQGVSNPIAAEGGANAETVTDVKTRGPQTLRHRGRSLSVADYEALAQAASPGVAIARALPATAPNGRPAPGWITLIIVPHSIEPEPQPSVELRRRVHDYLAARAPSTMDPGRIAVVGPIYLPIGVEAVIAPHDVNEAGAVEERVQLALQQFLHPLTGGPEGLGWPFGRNVYLSDAAALLESVEGVDYVRELNLLLRNTPRGEQVVVPPDRIVVAGSFRIEMEATEDMHGGT